MDSTQYQERALRTECDYEPVRQRLAQFPELITSIRRVLLEGIDSGESETDLKRSLIYGKGNLLNFVKKIERKRTLEDLAPEEQRAYTLLQENPVLLRLLHAHLGRLSEAAEAQSHLWNVLFCDSQLNLAYLLGEAGDGQWFQAIENDALGFSFEQEQDANIVKLATRYPEKFTEEAGSNRNLEAEDAGLAAAVQDGRYSTADFPKEV